jgi:nucleotide-binding universal stress UspA family protein
MFGRIVVPLDGSRFAERAIAPGVQLARSTDAQLVLVGVGEDQRVGAYVREQGRSLPVPATTLFIEQALDPAAVITAMGGPDTLISMATHGRTGVRRAAVGSIAEAVLRESDEPVLLTGPVAWRELPASGGELLVCLDGSERAEVILPAVRDWAKTLDMHVWLASAVSPDASARRRQVDYDVLESGYLAAMAHSLGLPAGRVDWDVLYAPQPGRALVGMARRIGASVVAMATHGRAGLARVVLGSIAMEMVHDAPCPVLVARAPGTA